VDEVVCLVNRRQYCRDELQVEHASFDRDVDEGRYGDLLIGAADDLPAAGPDRLTLVAHADPQVIAQSSRGMTDQGVDRLGAGLRVRRGPHLVDDRAVPTAVPIANDLIVHAERRY